MKEQYLSDCMTWWAGVTKSRGGARGEPGAGNVAELTRGRVTKPIGSGPLGEQQKKSLVRALFTLGGTMANDEATSRIDETDARLLSSRLIIDSRCVCAWWMCKCQGQR